MLVHPNDCDAPHAVSRPEQVIDLANEFVRNGWDKTKPKLIAYPYNGRLQLLSGTHRQAAAKLAEIDIPIVLVSYETVEKTWGTDNWFLLMQLGN